ncbi:MAG: pectate lyase, partial [Bacteroides sp.]|nr:pectate lyase [Bacteroides sp.]
LRWALKKNGPKTIVFDVAGTIHLKTELRTQKDDLTIAGQTSPGGICLADYAFVINSNNVIIRFLRFRPGDASGKEPDGLGGMDYKNVIVDHCSVSWSVDECLSVYGMEHSTVQWCIASQSLLLSTHSKGTHGYGGNWGGNKASYHHNLIAHCKSRTPRLGPRQSTQMNEYVDIRNNVFYNWSGEGCYGGENQHINIVNNYYKPGPATKEKGADHRICYRIAKIGVRTTDYVTNDDGTPNGWKPSEHLWGTFYITGNKVEGYSDVTADNWTKGVYAQQENGKGVDNLWTEEVKAAIRKEEAVVNTGGMTLHTADVAYSKVLSYVGACNYRDIIDELIVGDVKNGKAGCTASGNSPGYITTPSDIAQALPELAPNPYPELKPDTSVATKDTDGDGMPDAWEKTYALNPNDPSDGTAKTVDKRDAYTNLEMYLNSLVQDIMEACCKEGPTAD